MELANHVFSLNEAGAPTLFTALAYVSHASCVITSVYLTEKAVFNTTT